MALVVQKFGGSSLNTLENRKKAVSKIVKAKKEGNDVVVVVSAMGRKNDPYATDTLLDLAFQHYNKTDLRNLDLLMSCGEIISSVVICAMLEGEGHEAVALTGFQAGITTDGNFSNAAVKQVKTEKIEKLLKEGKIPVVAGFQGCTEDFEITTLGRGGSDITAIVLGGYLKADVVEIYTDVPGVAVIDPSIYPLTKFLKNLSFDEMINMAACGAKVMHPKAVEYAKIFKMPFYVKSTFYDGEGTLVGFNDSNESITGIVIKDEELSLIFSREKRLSKSEERKVMNILKQYDYKEVCFSSSTYKVCLNRWSAKEAALKIYQEFYEEDFNKKAISF